MTPAVAPAKRVLLTVNPQLLEGKRFSTVRSMVNCLRKRAELLIVPVGGYDFERGTVCAYRRVRGGKFECIGPVKPEADLWIVYSDGYYLDCKKFGFKLRREFFQAQVRFHEEQLRSRNVGMMVNSPAAETRTLKNWFVALDPETTGVLPTYTFSGFDALRAFREARGEMVAKPNWGGGGQAVRKISSDQDLIRFQKEVEASPDSDLSDYSFQVYAPGPEKRFWFVGGKCAAARICWDRAEPWAPTRTEKFRAEPYDEQFGAQFQADLQAAQRMCDLAGLTIGAVDLIGDRVNDINGCGTLFTQYVNWKLVADARPALTRYLTEIVSCL